MADDNHKLLLKCGIKLDNLCTFCQRVPEKIEHLFWYCNIVMEFWENIENWIYEKNQYLVNIDKKVPSSVYVIKMNLINL